MNLSKPIKQLPELGDTHEWACEHGCSDINPKLFKNIYVQRYDSSGVLLEQKAEFYYTCQQNHVLEVYDTESGDYVELPAEAYTSRKNTHDLTIESVKKIRTLLNDGVPERLSTTKEEADFLKSLTMAFEVILKDGSVIHINNPYLDEIEVLFDQDNDGE